MTSVPPHRDPAFPDPGNTGDRARLDELLADRAVQGLPAEQESEVRDLLARAGETDDAAFDHAAAALSVALHASSGDASPMPADVRARILQKGQEWAAMTRGQAKPALRLTEQTAPASTQVERKPRVVPVIRFRDRIAGLSLTWGGWAVAAASLAFAAMYSTRDPNAPVTPPDLGSGLAILSPNEAFGKLDQRAAAGDDIVAMSGEKQDGVEADLRFDPESREGFVAIAGLDSTDNSSQQYQVWLLDAGRTHPVDGGTFDIHDVQRGAKVIIPVKPRLPVRSPMGFAISRGAPGGVVVPESDSILLKAAMPLTGPLPENEPAQAP